MRSPLRRSLTAKLLAAQLAVIVAGSGTLTLVALLLGPTLYRRHMRAALGIVPPSVLHHLDQAFDESLAISLGVAIVAAALAAALVSWALSSRVVRPVRALAVAARRVSRGDYGARVNVTGEDEITVLARTFNEMAGALASSEERRRRLLADVAHELRTPLATLDAYLEGLADGVVAAKPETWRLLRAETARLGRLTEDVAKVSRAEEHQLDLHRARISAGRLLADAAQATHAAYDAKGVALEIDSNDHPPEVDVDPDRLAEVLANLLDNALRHTAPGGSVTLAANHDGADALLSVTDTGEGLEPTELERIFERFYRADTSRSRDRGGSGIGLTIARALAEAHGGSLWAESKGRGSGTRLVLRVPSA